MINPNDLVQTNYFQNITVREKTNYLRKKITEIEAEASATMKRISEAQTKHREDSKTIEGLENKQKILTEIYKKYLEENQRAKQKLNEAKSNLQAQREAFNADAHAFAEKFDVKPFLRQFGANGAMESLQDISNQGDVSDQEGAKKLP